MRYLSVAVIAACVFLSRQDGHQEQAEPMTEPPAVSSPQTTGTGSGSSRRTGTEHAAGGSDQHARMPMPMGNDKKGDDDGPIYVHGGSSSDDDEYDEPKAEMSQSESAVGVMGQGMMGQGMMGQGMGGPGMMSGRSGGIKLSINLDIGSMLMGGANMGGMVGGGQPQGRRDDRPMQRRMPQPRPRPSACPKEDHPFICSIVIDNARDWNCTRTCRGKPCGKNGFVDDGWLFFVCPDRMDMQFGDMLRKHGMMKVHGMIRDYIMDRDDVREMVSSYMDDDLNELMGDLKPEDTLRHLMQIELEEQLRKLERMNNDMNKGDDNAMSGRGMNGGRMRPCPRKHKPRICKVYDATTDMGMNRSCLGEVKCPEKGIRTGNWTIHVCPMDAKTMLAAVKFGLGLVKDRVDEEKQMERQDMDDMMGRRPGMMGGYGDDRMGPDYRRRDMYDQGYDRRNDARYGQ